jgi:hypothetical protein
MTIHIFKSIRTLTKEHLRPTERQNITQWNRTLTQEQTRSKVKQNIDQGETKKVNTTPEVRPYMQLEN